MKDTIFVSVGSYRDSICHKTIESLYKNARHPKNVFVGICQQNDKGDSDCFEDGLKDLPEYRDNVRIMRLAHYQARGPTYARFLCSTLYNNEEYFLQVDSHVLFIEDWDVLLIGMILDLKKQGVNRPVLSHYTPNYTDYQPKPDPKNPISTICKAWFTDTNLISLQGAGWVQADDLPRPNAYIAAGMFFCEGKFIHDIPFDPELDFLFIGEELLLSARFYTHGWDIFTPNRNTIYHMYTRESDPKFWENQHIDSEQASQRARYILGLDTDKSKLSPRQLYLAEKYGLGKERTLDDYYRHAGIDIQKKEVLKNMCEDNNLRLERRYNATAPEEQPRPQVDNDTKPSKKPKSTSISSTIFTICSCIVYIFFFFMVAWGIYQYTMTSIPVSRRPHVQHRPIVPTTTTKRVLV